MDGLVLNFDDAAGGGLVRADDGSRYEFAREDWKSPEPPRSGDRVDFVPAGDRATEIYLIRSPLTESSATGARVTASYLAARPGLPLAGAILLSCFLPFLSVPFFSLTLFGLPNTMSMFLNLATSFGRDAHGVDVQSLRLAIWSLYLLYLIPLAAGWLIFREIRAEATRRLRLAVGIVGLATPILVSILSSSLAGSAARTVRRGPDTVPNPFEFSANVLSFMGAGWILLIFASAALVAIGLGWNPFAGSRGSRSD